VLRWSSCALLALFALALAAGSDPVPTATGAPWPEADVLFSNDPLWLGADGAYSADLGGGRVLWLFGDSLIARDATRSRADPYFIRNSVAIETGYDPSQAFMEFFWADDGCGPSSFFPQQGANWFWPSQAVRLGDSLLIFYERLASTGVGQFAFEGAGYTVVRVDNPDDPPSAWTLHELTPPATSFYADVGNGAIVTGGYLYAFVGLDGHDYGVVRWPESDAEAGDLSGATWWKGGAWLSASAVSGQPDGVLGIGAPEFSVHYEPRFGQFLMVQSEGYGPTTLALRAAPSIQGPWSDPDSFYRPVQSFDPNGFVYAGKGHTALVGADLIATYVSSGFDGTVEAADPGSYYPLFVRVTLQ
jgi:hypothetical protein